MKPEESIIRLLQQQFVVKVDDTYGSAGVDDFRRCLGHLRLLYKNVSLDRYVSITAFEGLFPYLKNKGKEMRLENIHSEKGDRLTICFIEDDRVVLFPPDVIDVESLSANTIVYYWDSNSSHSDQFYIKGELICFSDEVTPEEGSLFAVRTYSDLDEALINYRDNVALMCNGRALTESMTTTRLFFNPAPEDLLQEALNEYLSCRLRNCDVKREHNVDESHPVDIIVSWRGTNHVALIEIKWLGKSLNEAQDRYTTYADARAREGASQLVSYIDANSDSFPKDVTMGYLVVYDLRRHKNTDVNRDKMTRADAEYYWDKEIAYNPKYEDLRNDFKKPYRFFIKVANEVYQD